MTEQRPHYEEEQSSGAPLLGPAVSRGSDAHAASGSDEEARPPIIDRPLGPFSGAPRPVTSHQADQDRVPAERTQREEESSVEALDLDWMSADETLWEEAPETPASEAEPASQQAAAVESADHDLLPGAESPWVKAAAADATASSSGDDEQHAEVSTDKGTGDWLSSNETQWSAVSEPDDLSPGVAGDAEHESEAPDFASLSGGYSPWGGSRELPQVSSADSGGSEMEAGAPDPAVDDPEAESPNLATQAVPPEGAALFSSSLVAEPDETAVQEDEAWLELDEMSAEEAAEWIATAEASRAGEAFLESPSIPTLKAEGAPLDSPQDEEPDSEVVVDEVLRESQEPLPLASASSEAVSTTPPALENVASRLERIARSLRDRTPGDLLADTKDPLQILLVGYALGLAESQQGPRPDDSKV